jgi:hypothetical protein
MTGNNNTCHFNATALLKFLFSFYSHMTIPQIGIHINTNISLTYNKKPRNYIMAFTMTDKALFIWQDRNASHFHLLAVLHTHEFSKTKRIVRRLEQNRSKCQNKYRILYRVFKKKRKLWWMLLHRISVQILPCWFYGFHSWCSFQQLIVFRELWINIWYLMITETERMYSGLQ